MYAHTFYNILFRIPFNSILCSSPGITGYAIIEVDGKYVRVEMLLSAVPFGDVKHTGDVILRAIQQQLTSMGLVSMSVRLLFQATRFCVPVCAHEGD